MQYKNIFVFFLSALLLLLSGCDKNNSASDNIGDENKQDKQDKQEKFYSDIGDWKVPIPLIQGKKKKHLTRPSVQLIDDKIGILYNSSRKIVFRYDNNEKVIEENTGAKQLWLFSNKKTKHIYVFWWKKTKEGKRLYFRGSSDLGKSFSKKVTVNSGGGILPTIDFASDEDGNLTVVYYDERKPPYQIYINTSSDNGKTWNAQDKRMDSDVNVRMKKIGEKQLPMAYAVDPMLTRFSDGKLLMVWQQRKVVDGRSHLQFASRTSTDHGKSWSEEHILYTADGDYPVESGLVNNGSDVVLVAAFSTTSGLLALSAKNTPSTEALEWNKIGFAPGTNKVNEISVLKPAISRNTFKVSFAIKKTQATKHSVEVASINLKEAKWESTFRLDRAKTQPVETQATYHDLKVLPNGEFITAWEDYRRLIPMLMLDYTTSEEKNWQKKPIPMTRGGLSAIKYPSIFVGSDSVWLIFEWYVYGGEKLPRLSSMRLPIDKETGLLKVVSAPKSKQLSSKEFKNKLKERASRFMDLRVKKEWEKTWDFMDPVYQLVTSKQSWLSKMGYLIYDDYKITDVKIDGVFATVAMDVVVSLRQQFRKGEIMEPSPPKKTHTTTKWLYFYDQWYFFPESSFSPHLKY